ncbi:MAG: AraC family transcriptional regulator, partial [Verrucomicrobiota bacterium]
MFGLKRKAEIIGKYDTEYCDDYVESMFRQDDESILNRGVHIRNKIELVTTMDGVLKWHITNKVPLYTRNKQIRGIAGITREFKREGATAHQHPALGRVIRFINEHYFEELSTSELASVAGLSISALGRNFKRTFHMTPAQYINRYRIQQACRLLSESDQPIASIASDCGFYDQSHFNRTFRNVIHSTPGSYRRRYQA